MSYPTIDGRRYSLAALRVLYAGVHVVGYDSKPPPFERLSIGYSRLPRRWRLRNATRSTAGTDFGRHGVESPVLGDLVVHTCRRGHPYAGSRCPLCVRAKTLTKRQWRRMEAERLSSEP